MAVRLAQAMSAPVAFTPALQPERLAPSLYKLRVHCSALGLVAPPVPFELQFIRAPVGWTLVVEAPSGVPGQAVAWLQAMGASVLVREPGQPTKAIRAHLQALPPPCATVMLNCRLESMTLKPNGQVALVVRGKEGAVHKLARDLDTPPQVVAPLLTARQAELLTFCVAKGYYEIPRKVTLRTLAAELGITATSLSLALRRAETKIVCSFAARLPAMPKG